MKIGVFDSGIGGEKIAQLLKEHYPDFDILAVSDKENMPYGNKPIEQLKALVIPKIIQMQADGCDCIVIACNTVTTLLISDIRKAIHVPVIGFEPMVKPAATITKTNIIAVCATPGTLQSSRYLDLKTRYARNTKIIEPDCSNWATLIEKNSITTKEIDAVISNLIKQGADVIVLGCTHYHWIESEIIRLAKNKAVILQPEQAILNRISTIINTLNA